MVTTANPICAPNHDASGSSPALGTLGTLLSTIAPNAARMGWVFQGQDANIFYIVLDDAVGGACTVLVMGASSATGVAGSYADGSGIPHSGRIRVYGTASNQFALAEF